MLIKNNAIPSLVELLQHINPEVVEQAVWVLGNIAGDGIAARDAVLGANALHYLIGCVSNKPKIALIRIVTWTISNLCDGQPRPSIDVESFLPTLNEFLKESDADTLRYCL